MTAQGTASRSKSSRPRLRLVPTCSKEPSIPAVLVVASGAEQCALEVLPDLVGCRISPSIVSGAEVSAGALEFAMERSSGPTVFVVCVTPELPPEAIPPLVQAFGQQRRPFHRLLVLDIIDRPNFIDEVQDAAQAIAEPSEIPSFPELEGFMTGSAAASTARGESAVADNDRSSVTVASAPVVVDGPVEAEGLAMRSRDRTRRPAGASPDLRVVEGGRSESPDDVDTAPSIPVGYLPVPRPTPAEASPPARRSYRVEIAGGLAFAVGLAIVPALIPADETETAGLPGHATSVVTTADSSAAPDTPSPDVESSPNDTPAPVDPMAAALDRGEVVDADAWWMVVARDGEVTWGAAAGRCRRHDIGGRDGFKLPTKSQLWALVRASVLPRGRYWTRSLARGTDDPSNWVFDPHVGHMVSTPKTGAARTVCLLAK